MTGANIQGGYSGPVQNVALASELPAIYPTPIDLNLVQKVHAATIDPTNGMVAQVFDSSRFRATLAQATPAKRATMAQDVYGRSYLQFTRAGVQLYSSAVWQYLVNQKVSVVVAFDQLDTSAYNVLFGLAGAGTERLYLTVTSAGQVQLTVVDNAGATTTLTSTVLVNDNLPHVVAVILDGKRSAIVIDGVPLYGDNSPVGTTVWTQAAIGSDVGGAFPSQCRLYGVEVFNDAITPQQYLASARRMTGNALLRIVNDGDSLTTGVGGSGGSYTYPALLQTALGLDCKGKQVVAVGGTDIAAALVRFNTSGMLYCYPWAETIAVLWENLNAIHNGTPLAQVQAQTIRWAAQYRSMGCRVLVCDGAQHLSIMRDGFAGTMDAYNAWVAQSWQTFCDAPVFLSKYINNYAGPYMYGDYDHLNDAGYALVASLVKDQIANIEGLYGL